VFLVCDRAFRRWNSPARHRLASNLVFAERRGDNCTVGAGPMGLPLAHYKVWKAWVLIGILSLLILSVPLLTLVLFEKIANGWRYHAYADMQCIIAWIAIIPVTCLVFGMIRQIVFRDARMIWTENDLLVWRAPLLNSVRRSEITRVMDGFEGDFGQFDVIKLRMRDGTEIATRLMRENLDDVVKRLSDIVGDIRSP
jgi:hypothetical protein